MAQVQPIAPKKGYSRVSFGEHGSTQSIELENASNGHLIASSGGGRSHHEGN
jgi:hypothetical protein